MRPLLASIAPVLPEIIRDTGLSHTGASLLTALPVLCLGLFAPAGPLLARSIGAERAVVTILMVLAASALLRSLVSAELLLFSALSAGAASGMLGALLPGMVKQEFPDRVGLMMGLYVTALCGGIAMASGATVPLQSWFGGAWNWALTAWGGPALIAAVLLWLQRSGPETMSQQNAGSAFGLWRDTLDWQVTFFMAFQLAITYCAFGWLAPILRERGLDPASAGMALSVSMLGQIGASLVVPIWAARQRQQRIAVAGSVGLSLAGLLGCLYLPLSGVWMCTILMGFGQGSMMSVALIIVVLRSPSPAVAMTLSGMSQCVGYGLASAGPLALGLLRDRAGHWDHAGPTVVILGFLAILFGWAAGAAGHVNVVPGRAVRLVVQQAE
jgi:CP family cyanate transporter-like MFS transporter